jgi:hypothetical protein
MYVCLSVFKILLKINYKYIIIPHIIIIVIKFDLSQNSSYELDKLTCESMHQRSLDFKNKKFEIILLWKKISVFINFIHNHVLG